MKNNIICFVAGKSGGHIIPCLTIAHRYKENNSTIKTLFFSANTALDKTILSNHEMISWHIMLPLSRLTNGTLCGYITTMMHAFHSFIVSFFYLCKYRPIEIISTGGIVAIPPCIAAFILRIPITLYALDVVPGKAIKMLAPFAYSIRVCFKTTEQFFPPKKCSLEPYPIKYNAAHGMLDQQSAKQKIGLALNKKTVLVLGGSQGSLFLNECIKQLLNQSTFDPAQIQFIHQTGSIDATNWQNIYASKKSTAHIFGYYPDLSSMYYAADIILCRAGAGTLFEIKFFEKKCIIIPLTTTTTSHQNDNARAMSADYPHLFEYIAQDVIEKNPSFLFSRIHQLLYSPLDIDKKNTIVYHHKIFR